MNTDELGDVKSISNLITYLAKNCDNYSDMIHVFNDISISVHARRKELNNKERTIESVSIMKEYLKDTSKQIHSIINEYYK
jgi:hypothetical protein